MKTLLFTIFIALALTDGVAQQAIVAAGSDAAGTGGSAAYSIGQITYTIQSDASHSIVQGVQQPYEISIVIGVNDEKSPVGLSLFPNPTMHEVVLQVKDISDLSFQLFDAFGKLLENQKILSTSTSIDMDRFAASIYFVKVYHNNQEIQTFKLIKN